MTKRSLLNKQKVVAKPNALSKKAKSKGIKKTKLDCDGSQKTVLKKYSLSLKYELSDPQT